jgi:AraC-like DNA-binding protein
MFHCGYAGSASGSRYERWREEFGRQWIGVDFEPIGGENIVNEISVSQHSYLGLCRLQGTPLHMVLRDDIAVAERGYFYLIIASGSRLQTHQRGRAIDLQAGGMALMSAGDAARVTQLLPGNRWSIRIPQLVLNGVCRSSEDKITRPLAASSELTGLLLHQVETAHRFGAKLDAAANQAVAQHILDLVGLCLGADQDAAHMAAARGLAAARLDAIKSDILRQIGRSDLGLERVARRHGLSPRYVQRLFERTGSSFTGFLLERRLLAAHRLLREAIGRRKVSDIAAAAGFADISYFNRAFKARFGATPTEIRARLREQRDGDGLPPDAAAVKATPPRP